MFHAVEKFRTSAQILLGLIGLSFIGFGVAGFELSDNNQYIVKIGDEVITRYELDRAVQNMQAAGGEINRQIAFNTLVDQAYLIEGAKKIGITISDDQIKQMIVDNPSFHNSNQQFDPTLFQAFIQRNFANETQFMEQERRRLTLLSLINTLNHGSVSDIQAKQLFKAQLAPRKVRTVPTLPETFISKVATDDTTLKTYYDAHQTDYVLPQAVKYEYVILSPQDLIEKQEVSKEEIQQALANQPTDAGKRHLAHILINAPKSADQATREKAKQQAEKIAAELKANPDAFAQLAKQYSEDTGSKDNGGDLGEFSKNGALGGDTLENAAFALQEGEISGVVESDFGYHILKASKIEVADKQNQEATVRRQLQQRKAQASYTKLREDFLNETFNHFNSLQPAAEKFGQTLHQHTEWLTQDNNNENIPQAVLNVLFNPDMINKQRNSEAINVNGNTWFVRVTEVRPSKTLAFEEVKDKVKTDWINHESTRLAQESAQNILADLQAGKEVKLAWSAAQEVWPQQIRQNLPEQAYQALINAIPKPNQPAFTMIEIQSIPQLIEVQSIDTQLDNQDIVLTTRQLLIQNNGNNLIESFINGLRSEIKTKQGAESISDN